MGRIENPDAFFKSHGALNREGSPIGKVIINEGRVTARSALNAHGEEHDKRRSGNGTLEFRNGHYVMRVPDNGRERGTPERNFNGAGIVRGGAHTSGHGSR